MVIKGQMTKISGSFWIYTSGEQFLRKIWMGHSPPHRPREPL